VLIFFEALNVPARKPAPTTAPLAARRIRVFRFVPGRKRRYPGFPRRLRRAQLFADPG